MSTIKKLTHKAPCRVDFSGGTADLWPLYLYLGGLELVHMAIDLQAEVKVQWKKATSKNKNWSCEISSLDLNQKSSHSSLESLYESLGMSSQANPLRWIQRIVYAKALQIPHLYGELKVSCRSDAPPGSGLGGSSVLGVALAQGLEKLWLPKNKQSPPWSLQKELRDLETVEIEFPAGEQDYVPALFGGLLIFHLGQNKRFIERLPSSTARYIGERSALLYTGQPHHSGINNWQVYMDFHNGKASTRKALEEIVKLSSQFANALRKKENILYPQLINREWELRQELSPAVSAPVLDEGWNYAQSLGAIARKACGAGGGGSLLVYFPDPQTKKEALKKALTQGGWKWLACNVKV